VLTGFLSDVSPRAVLHYHAKVQTTMCDQAMWMLTHTYCDRDRREFLQRSSTTWSVPLLIRHWGRSRISSYLVSPRLDFTLLTLLYLVSLRRVKLVRFATRNALVDCCSRSAVSELKRPNDSTTRNAARARHAGCRLVGVSLRERSSQADTDDDQCWHNALSKH
jgi:hypothetical protein